MGNETFTHAHRVSYSECTIGNHVYYARYLDFLETARGEFFRHAGLTFRELHEKQDAIFPVVEVHLRYKAAARYDDILRIELWMNEISRVRLRFGCRILNQDNVVILEGDTVHVCTSPGEKLQRVPEELTAKLQRFLCKTGAAT